MARKNRLLEYLIKRNVLGTTQEVQARRDYYNMLRRESRKRKQENYKSFKVWFSHPEVKKLEAQAINAKISVTSLIQQRALHSSVRSPINHTVLNEVLSKLNYVYEVEQTVYEDISAVSRERMARLEQLYTELVKLLKPC
ncbi:MAG: hypothetical protein R2800_03270 [Flavipsychrobacter sp.]